MGQGIYAYDRVTSAGDFETYVQPGLISGSPEHKQSITDRAVAIAADLATDRKLDDLRASMGDCALAFHIVGILSTEEAASAAVQLHLDPVQQDRIVSFGGLFVGAEAALISLESQSAAGANE